MTWTKIRKNFFQKLVRKVDNTAHGLSIGGVIYGHGVGSRVTRKSPASINYFILIGRFSTYSPVQNSCRFHNNKHQVGQHPFKIHFSIISQPIMRNKINAARKHCRKHSSTSLEHQNSNPSSNASTKRVKKSKLNAKTSPPVDTMSNPSEILEESIEHVLDIKNQVFTISYCIMLGSIPVEEDAERVKLGEFKYRNFEVQAIKMVDRAVTKAGCGFE